MAGHHPLADDALAGGEVVHARPELDDLAAPLVARDDREADETGIQLAGEDLEVRAADPGPQAADENLARPGDGRLNLAVDGRSGPLEDDCAHRPTIVA